MLEDFIVNLVVMYGLIKARYKIISEKTIKDYLNEQDSSEKTNTFFNREFNPLGKAKQLTGGRLNSVYKINYGGEDKVIKLSTGKYRVSELTREAEIMKYITNSGYNNIVPSIYESKKLDNFAYLIEDYIEGKTVREKLNLNEGTEERQKMWEKVGQVLSEIHMLWNDENIKGEWLEEQFKIGKINMENKLIDPEEFQEETPEEMLKWLIVNKPDIKQTSLLHGDFRTKNIMVDNEDNYKVIDWGFVDIDRRSFL